MEYVAQTRAYVASTGLMWLAIGFGALSFWSPAFAAGSIVDYPVEWITAAMLSFALIFVSFLLSGSVVRFATAQELGHNWTAGLVVIQGIVLCLIEAGMTHQGLAWLDASKDLGPDWALWVASFGLSILNVFSLYTFARDLKRRHKPETSAGKLLAFKRWNKAA